MSVFPILHVDTLSTVADCRTVRFLLIAYGGRAPVTRFAHLLRAGNGSSRRRRRWPGVRPCRQGRRAVADRMSPSTGSITHTVPSC